MYVRYDEQYTCKVNTKLGDYSNKSNVTLKGVTPEETAKEISETHKVDNEVPEVLSENDVFLLNGKESSWQAVA